MDCLDAAHGVIETNSPSVRLAVAEKLVGDKTDGPVVKGKNVD